MNEIWIIRSTFAKKDEAVLVAKTLLSEKLIACANISEQISSLYRWEGKAQQEFEVEFLAKTLGAKVDSAMQRLKALHTYQIPAITAWRAEKANEVFAEWVAEETA